MTDSHDPFHDASGPGGGHDDSRDDNVETRLRRALTSEAAMVQPAGDGLQKIRAGVDGQRRRAWWQHPAVALVAAAVLGLAVGGLYFGLRGDDQGNDVVAAPSDSTSASASASPSPSASGSSSPQTTVGTSAYVYYVHDDGQSPRLYREQHTVRAKVADGQPVSKADLGLVAMLNDEPADPDYASPWPAGVGIIGGVQKSGDTATVNLTDFMSQGAEVEKAGMQQLVYTVTANDPSVKKVRVLVQGKTPQGHSDWSQPVARAPMVDVQGLIWLLAPSQGATVSAPVTIDGFGTAFEGTISWEVRKDGVVVKDGVTSGGANGEFAEFHDTVTLAPGDYEISAFESSAKDGSPIHVDTKNFTVK
ncbi:MAG: Gmad2 immunoglobulin-like domain-containing protein [Actinomycetes bacterium]